MQESSFFRKFQILKLCYQFVFVIIINCHIGIKHLIIHLDCHTENWPPQLPTDREIKDLRLFFIYFFGIDLTYLVQGRSYSLIRMISIFYWKIISNIYIQIQSNILIYYKLNTLHIIKSDSLANYSKKCCVSAPLRENYWLFKNLNTLSEILYSNTNIINYISSILTWHIPWVI